MKTQIIIILLFNFSIFQSYGQNDNEGKNRFAKKAFETEYKKENYPNYNGKIKIIDENTLKFGERTLNISVDENSLKNIFKKGIFNPNVVFGKLTTKPLTQSELDSLSTTEKVFYNLGRNDNLRICCIEELKELNPNPQTKRFKFWLFRPGMANPTEYYFEIFNENASKKTTFDEFLENAKMTFYYKGTIII